MHDNDTVAGWRGQELVDREGEKIGKVVDVYLDRHSDNAEWVTVKMGLLGRRQAFVPIREATSEGGMVRVPFDKAEVERAPEIDPESGLTPHQEADLYNHFGMDYGSPGAEHGRPAEGGTEHEQPQEYAAQEHGQYTDQPGQGQYADQPGQGQYADQLGQGQYADDQNQAQYVDQQGQGQYAEQEHSPQQEQGAEPAYAAGQGQPQPAGGGSEWKVDRVGEQPAEESGEQSVEPRLRLKKYIVREEVRIPVEREETRIERE